MKFYKLLSLLLIAFAFQAAFAAPVKKLTANCPNGYRTDGASGYCTASSSSSPAPDVVPKVNYNCPTGYRTDGSSGYCTKK